MSPSLTLRRRDRRRALAAALRALGLRVRRWHDLWAQRRALARLDDRMLRDIGVDRITARREARRPFWDEPREWRP